MKPRMKVVKKGNERIGIPHERTDRDKSIMAVAKSIKELNRKNLGMEFVVPVLGSIAFKVINKNPLGAGKGVSYAMNTFYPFYSYIVEFKVKAMKHGDSNKKGYQTNKSVILSGRIRFQDSINEHGIQDVTVQEITWE